MDKSQISRRAFLAAATTTAVMAGCQTKPNTAQVVPGKVSPNEKLNIAGIGGGGKGRDDILSCKQLRENIVAIADVDWNSAGETFYRCPDAKKYRDYRKMLEAMDKQIDAVTVTTPDHTHAPAAYMAMKMGKHVYVQKPLTHTVAEARLLAKTAREMKVMTQMGNQGHSGGGVRKACEMIWAGAIGQVKEVHIWTDRPRGRWAQGIADPLPEEPVPAELPWDLWIGTAPMRPYNKGYHPHKWRGWWDFGCGALGDMACHIMDPAFWALRLGDAKSYSVEIVKQDGTNKQTCPMNSVVKYSFPARDKQGPVDVYWYDNGQLPARPKDIPEGQKIGDDKNGSLFIGENGFLTAGEYGGDPRLLPDERMTNYKFPAETLPRVSTHYRDWAEACKKGGAKPCSNFDYSGPFTEMVLVGSIAQRVQRKFAWDVTAMKSPDCPDANALVSKPYRKGWELPV